MEFINKSYEKINLSPFSVYYASIAERVEGGWCGDTGKQQEQINQNAEKNDGVHGE